MMIARSTLIHSWIEIKSHTFAGSIGFSTISFGTGTVADPTCDLYTFSTMWTLFSFRTIGQYTLSINNFVRWLALTFDAVTFFAQWKWISVEPRRTLALVAPWQVLTDGVYPTGRLVPRFEALVDVPTLARIHVASVSPLTDTDAASDELVLDALLADRARCVRPADVRQFGLHAAASVGVADHAAGALTGERAGLVVANSSGRTGICRTFINVPAAVLHSWLSAEAVLTEARGNVVH